MASEFLSVKEAARRLGLKVPTLYDWLGKSDRGILWIQGIQVTIEYFQSGRRGQGKIQIEAIEVERVRECMRSRPRVLPVRRRNPPQSFPGITVPLGRPKTS